MYKNIKTELEKLAAEDPTMANRVAAIILEKMATDANGEATPMGVAIGGAVDETAFAGDMAAKAEQERRGEPDELLENMEAISAPEEFTAEGVADMEVPATDVAEAFLSQRTASEVVNDLYKLASEEPDLAEKLASAILELGQIDIPEKTATELMENIQKLAEEDMEEAEKLASDVIINMAAEKIAADLMGK